MTFLHAPAPLIDIGINIGSKQFDHDRAAVLSRARLANVTGLILTGTDIQGSVDALEMAKEHPNLWSTAGIHPHHANDINQDALSALSSLLTQHKVRAIGECGLDFFRELSPRDAQIFALEAQLELAAQSGLPVFLHEREASAVMIPLLREWRSRISAGVIHCFTGNREELYAYLDLDLHIGMTGWICDERRGRHLQDLIRDIPRGRLMLETDAPYLIPRDLPIKIPSRRNEPAFLPHIAERIASHRQEDWRYLCQHTTDCAMRFFNLLPDALHPEEKMASEFPSSLSD